MTLKLSLNNVRAVVKVGVREKYHQAECSGSWVRANKLFCHISWWWKIGKSGPV